MKNFTKIQMLMAVLMLAMQCFVLPIQAQLNGKFSVSSSKQVRFSKGNLVYNCSSKTFSFATTQYAVIGTSNSTNIANKSGSIDLFGWGTSGYNNCMPYETSLSVVYGGGGSSITGTQYDWGVKNFSGYRTLTNDEWGYLLSSRSNALALKAPATVNGVCGWILLPDNWSKPSSITFKSYADGAKTYSSNSYTTSQFSTMESAGAVFLPAAGWRYSSGGLGVSANVTSYVNSQGYYWTANSGTALNFMYNYCVSGQDADNFSGCAVRLVYDAGSGGGGGGSTTQYTITTKVDPAGAGTVTGAGTYDQYKYITIQAYPNAEWEFVNFTASNYPYSSTYNPWGFTVANDNVITAHFQQKKYPVYGQSANYTKGSVEPAGYLEPKGTKVTFTAVPKAGCRFVRWTDGITTATRTYTIKGTENFTDNEVVFRAEFESVSKFTLTPVSAQSTMGTVSDPVTVDAGNPARATAYPKEGYKFVNWTLSNSSQKITSNPLIMDMYENLTATANFAAAQKVTITVSAEPSNGGTVSGGGSYKEQETVYLSATPNAMMIFVRWEKRNTNGTWTSVSTNAEYSFKATEDASYRAVFEPVSKITFSATADETQGVVIISPEKNGYYEGEQVVIEAVPNACYAFTQWSDGNTENPRTIELHTANLVLEALFEEHKEKLNVISESSLKGLVRINEKEENFEAKMLIFACAGEEVTLEAQGKDGYSFDHWGDGNTENPRKFIITPEVKSIKAYFNKYTFGGYCGFDYMNAPYPTEAAWWLYDEYGNIKIEGEGRIHEFGYQVVSASGTLVTAADWYDILKNETTQDIKINVGSGITSLPQYAFTGCYAVRNINLKHSGITHIYNDAFTYTSLESIVLPDSLEYLDNAVFTETAIQEIILPEKLSHMGQNTFGFCYDLMRVIFTNPMPIPLGGSIWSWTFAGADVVYVPDGTKQAYIDAGYLNSGSGYYMPFKKVVEWHRVQVETRGNGVCKADTINYVGTGHVVTLTVKPDEGYELASLSVVSATGESVVLSQNNQFVMPESHVTVKAVFRKQIQGIEEVSVPENDPAHKVLRDGQILILRGDKAYTVTGQEVR